MTFPSGIAYCVEEVVEPTSCSEKIVAVILRFNVVRPKEVVIISIFFAIQLELLEILYIGHNGSLLKVSCTSEVYTLSYEVCGEVDMCEELSYQSLICTISTQIRTALHDLYMERTPVLFVTVGIPHLEFIPEPVDLGADQVLPI